MRLKGQEGVDVGIHRGCYLQSKSRRRKLSQNLASSSCLPCTCLGRAPSLCSVGSNLNRQSSGIGDGLQHMH